MQEVVEKENFHKKRAVYRQQGTLCAVTLLCLGRKTMKMRSRLFYFIFFKRKTFEKNLPPIYNSKIYVDISIYRSVLPKD